MFKVTEDHVFVEIPQGYKTFAEEVLNGTYSKRYNAHRFPKNYHALRELAKAFPQLLQERAFVESGVRLGESRSRLALRKTKLDTAGDNRLRCYQRVDIEYLKTLPAALIGNEARTGKTPVSILLMKELNTLKNLVISPASLIWNWASEFENWDKEMTVYVVSGTPAKRKRIYDDYHKWKGRKVLIVSKDTWKTDILNTNFDTCFVDEAHFLRNPKTAQSKAVFKTKATRRYALTGTPTVKHAADIYGILHFLYPSKFSSYWDFVGRYFQVGEDFMGHKEIGPVKPDRQQELEELVGFISVQRKRKDVMVWLPEKQYQTIPVVLESKQLKLYERMRDDFLAYLDEDDSEHRVDTSGVLPQLMRLRQLCLDPRLVGFDVRGAKTDAIVEWCDNNREPVVIMSMFTSYLKLLKPELEKMGLRVDFIHGEMSNAQKQEVSNRFQKGNLDVLLCNIISAGTGFTLDRAETIIFLDLPYNYSDLSQAEDRITPVSKDRLHSMNVIKFVCNNTIDNRIMTILDNKKSLTDIVNEGGAKALATLV